MDGDTLDIMNSPLQITLRDAPRSEALENRIREQAVKLERFFADIMNCRVSVSRARSGKDAGSQSGLYTVRVDLHVPGEEIVTVGNNEDALAAVREAFTHASRQLQQHAQRLRGHDRHVSAA
jgi:ribosomal subunit interface protein